MSTQQRTRRPYGIDFGIRDPVGDAIRIGQMFDSAASCDTGCAERESERASFDQGIGHGHANALVAHLRS